MRNQQRWAWLPLCALPLAVVGCHGGGGGGGGPVGASQAEVAVQVDGILKTGLNSINADAVAALFFDAEASNDPFVLDTRDAADFAAGHIPGAVNVPLRQFPARYLAEGASLIPADKNVVVASYFGGDGNMASFLINAVRITDPAAYATAKWAKTIMMGMQAWTFDKALAAGHRFPDDLDVTRIVAATETTANAGTAHALAAFPGVDRTAVAEAILQRAAIYFARYADQLDLQLAPKALKTELDDGNAADDPQILSVRSAADYAKGHLPGAINIPWQNVAVLTNSALLDPNRPVVAYCYTGHTGSLASVALGILGYDVRNLMYGMCGWNPVAAVTATQLNNFDLNRGWDLPIDNGGGSDLGNLAAYVPPTGCLDCHSSLTGIFYDLTVNPPPTATAPPSTGEG